MGKEDLGKKEEGRYREGWEGKRESKKRRI